MKNRSVGVSTPRATAAVPLNSGTAGIATPHATTRTTVTGIATPRATTVLFAALTALALAVCMTLSTAPAYAAPEEATTSATSEASSEQILGAAGTAGEVGAEATGRLAAEAAAQEEAESAIILPGGSTNAVDPRQTPDNSFLYDTSIVDLTNADSSFQGKTVQITGEVVGDAIRAEEDPGKHWITLESLDEGKSNSISVLIDDSYLELIDSYGSYGSIGASLQIRGTFHLTCTSHEGIMDLHADTVKLVSPGNAIERAFDFDDFTPGIALAVLGFGLMFIYGRMRERER